MHTIQVHVFKYIQMYCIVPTYVYITYMVNKSMSGLIQCMILHMNVRYIKNLWVIFWLSFFFLNYAVFYFYFNWYIQYTCMRLPCLRKRTLWPLWRMLYCFLFVIGRFFYYCLCIIVGNLFIYWAIGPGNKTINQRVISNWN